MAKQALVIVDLQNDFCPGGSLAVPEGDQNVPIVNRLIERFTEAGSPVYATRDWHPKDHVSFKAQGGPWPPHCVQNTLGAEFHPGMKLPVEALIVSKADNKDQDAYSMFDETDMAGQLKATGVDEIIVCGLATDYCVKATALDGVQTGLKVTVVEDAIRGVEVEPGDSQRALGEMKAAGVRLTSSADV
jgi:nicotinamidase-related amidase